MSHPPLEQTFRPSAKELEFLTALTKATIDDASVAPGTEVVSDCNGFKITRRNQLAFPAIRPGGRLCYPAIWVQDFTMTYASGCVSRETARQTLELIACSQHGAVPRELEKGALIPAYAVPDHINLDGAAVFFPGSYSSGQDQGGEPWGLRPPMNNAYDFIWLASLLIKDLGTHLLEQEMGGLPLSDRLVKAFDSVETEASTELAYTSKENRAVGFIFCDSVYMTGHLLTASILRWRAARQLHALTDLERFDEVARKIEHHLGRTFADPGGSGWLVASTGVSAQPDVWGTLQSLYHGLLKEEQAEAATNELLTALQKGTIAYRSALRHVPTDRDAHSESAWEKSVTPHQRYQNGAYWHTPLGWLLAVLIRERSDLADSLWSQYLEYLMLEDFRKGPSSTAPLECLGPDSEANSNPLFLPSVALPLAVLNRELSRQNGGNYQTWQ